ncbi:hypothetical protein EUTSA_v10002168mg [Eutrema salsugineum]|uniref:CCHC-type domain-containing protein n=1 Tax=Eutrema salsugineum TaxID=72664 RepID=V4M1S9_EUTSA|nr:hypothetical protein EUTSA_v10002168mg [Eutrema salsugineum]
MPKRNDEEIVFDDGEDEDNDYEGNEDLSLKILEKALSRRDSKETSMLDLSGFGVVNTVIVNGGNSKSSKKMNLYQSIGSKDQSEDKMMEDLTKGKDDDDEVKCGEQGHVTVNCPTPIKRRRPCFICGSLEHGAKQCSKGHDCYICKKGGHRAKDCPDKYKSGSKTTICLRCGDSGHDMILCKYEYSQDDSKVCKSFGHLCCVEPGNSPLWAVFKRNRELFIPSHKSNKRNKQNSEHTPTPHESNRKAKNKENSEHISIPRESNGKTKKKKNKKNLEHNYTAHESNRETKKKKNKETSEHYSTPRESNGKMKMKKTHKREHGEHPQTTPQKPKLRGGWMRDVREDYSFQRGNIRRPRSPITSGHNHHRLPTTYIGHTHNHRSPTFSSGGHYLGSQSTTPYGRNHRNSSYESSGHLSNHPYSRYELAPSRYGSTHHYSEFPKNYGRW